MSYYAWRDSDGAWTEGSKHDTVVVPSVPGGRYYLRIEPEGEAGRRSLVNYTLTVRRDVPSLALFIIAAGVLALPPIFVTWRSLVFERARWNESDYGEGED